MPTLVTLRHGESLWNATNQFTGWIDVDLSERGIAEAEAAGALLQSTELPPVDVVHTSLLMRAIRTAEIALHATGRSFVPVRRHWRLNERHYGALQGLDKKETAERYGLEQVQLWRRSYDTPPPPLADDDPTHPRRDPRYASVAPSALPSGECLADVVRRLVPYYEDVIAGDLLSRRTVFVVAHGNSLRALMKHLEGLSDEAIVAEEIPTGVPRVYELDDTLQVVKATYLGDPDVIARAQEGVRRQAG